MTISFVHPLFLFANVYYQLSSQAHREGDPDSFVIGVSRAAYPDELDELDDSNVKATEQPRCLIDDFSIGFEGGVLIL